MNERERYAKLLHNFRDQDWLREEHIRGETAMAYGAALERGDLPQCRAIRRFAAGDAAMLRELREVMRDWRAGVRGWCE